jgi:CRP-like cAMP-binding protein
MATLPRPHTPHSKPGSEPLGLQELAKLGVPPRFVASRIVKDSDAIRGTARLQHYALFSNISSGDLDAIVGAASRYEIPRGRTVQIEGEPVRQLVLITLGSAKVVQVSPNRTEVILHICGPGELIDPLGIAQRGVYRSTAKTMQVCEAIAWEIGTFDSLLRQYSVLRLNAALILDKQLKDMENRFREISTERVEMRLSRQIVRLINQVGRRVNGSIEITISREELAQFTGTTVFNVSRLLSKWSRQGIVRARRDAVSIYDLKALEEFPGSVVQHFPQRLESACSK